MNSFISESADEKIKTIPVALLTPSQMSTFKDPQALFSQENVTKVASSKIGGLHGLRTLRESTDRKLSDQLSDDVIVVESGRVSEPARKRFVSSSSFMRLENKVKSLQAQLETMSSQMLPTDDVLLDTARSHQDTKPIADLLKSLNITKRMSGAEEGIDRLASLLETVAKEYADLRHVIDLIQQEFGDDLGETLHGIKTAANYAKQIKPREHLFGHLVKKLQTKPEPSSLSKGPSTETGEVKITDLGEANLELPLTREGTEELRDENKVGGEQITMRQMNLPQHEGPFKDSQDDELTRVLQAIPENQEVTRTKVNNILLQHEHMKNVLEQMIAQVNTIADVVDVVLPDLVNEIPHMEGIRKKLAELRRSGDHQPGSLVSLSYDDTRQAGRESASTSSDKIRELEARLAKYAAKVKRLEYMLCEKTLEYDVRLTDMVKSVLDLSHRVDEVMQNQNPAENEIKEILDKMKGLEEAVIEVGCSAQELQEDAEQKNVLFETLASELELLKSAKADRFELETGLSEKADCEALKRKLSLDIFEVACTDLSKGIDEALNRISLQENLLSTTGLELQNTIETKLDRVDLEPMKAEIEDKIDSLAQEVERIANVKDGKVAAGAKQKYITTVNCLSCDRNVSMRTETDVPSIPAMADFPSRKTIRPYITYELDYLRRMRNKDPEVEKYITYEELARRYKIKNLESFENLENVPHLSTRYCGGSHTVLGPQQKVVHTGHFPLREDPHHRK